MKTITATIHYDIIPPWAVLERKLIDLLHCGLARILLWHNLHLEKINPKER